MLYLCHLTTYLKVETAGKTLCGDAFLIIEFWIQKAI